MTTQPQATQTCPSCGALVNYEGHEDLKKRALVRHRFHCHRCGRVYIVQSTQHKMPKFALKAAHELPVPAGVDPHTGEMAEGAEEHDHDHEGHDDEGHTH